MAESDLRSDKGKGHLATGVGQAARHRIDIPGPGGPPLLDWTVHILPLLADPVVGMLKLQRQYGDIVALGRSSSAPVLLFAPENVYQLLTDTNLFHSADVNSDTSLVRMPADTAASRLLSGVASMNGDTHRQHRRMLLPAFHRQYVDALRDRLVTCIESHLAHWQAGQQLDLVDEMVELSLSLAVTGLLGLSPDQDGKRVHTLLQAWSTSALSLPVHLLPFNLPGLPYRRFLHLSERLEVEMRDIINRQQARMGTDGKTSARNDALSILLSVYGAQDTAGADDPPPQKAGVRMSEKQLLGHLTTLFSSGHETSASALVWTLFLLMQHPDVLTDLVDELDGKLHGDAPTVEQLSELPLLNHVINESLRLFPPGMWMLRTSTHPSDIGPYHLPARTQIIYSPAVIHRRPELYPDPNRFLPRRWETIDPSPYEYLPFGAGQRRCIGATFATMELQLATALVVQRFRLTIPDGTKVNRGGTILSFPHPGLPAIVSKQDHRFHAARLRGNIYGALAP